MYAASRDRLLVAAGRVHPETRSRARLSRTRSEPGPPWAESQVFRATLRAWVCGVCSVSGAPTPLPRIFQACNICSRRTSVAAWKSDAVKMPLRVRDDRPLATRRRALPCSPLAADRSLSRTPSSKAARRTPLSASGPSGVSFLSLRRPPVPERVGPEARFLRGGEPDRFSPLARRHSPLASTFATDALALAPPSKSPPPPSLTPSPTTRSSKGFVRRKLALIYTPAVAASAGLTVGA